MPVIDLDEDAVAGHLLVALQQHLVWCRRNDVPFPPSLTALLDRLLARRGQELPTAARAAAGVQPLSVSITTAAEMTGLSTRTLRRRIADGRLPAAQVGRRRVIRVDHLDALVRP